MFAYLEQRRTTYRIKHQNHAQHRGSHGREQPVSPVFVDANGHRQEISEPQGNEAGNDHDLPHYDGVVEVRAIEHKYLDNILGDLKNNI